VTRLRLALASTVVLGLAATPAVAAAETVVLDTYKPRTVKGKYIGPVATKAKLTRGKPYIATVRGTWSYLDTSKEMLCGAPEPRPIYPTRAKGVRNRQAVADAEFYFAQRAPDCADPTKIVERAVRFEIATARLYNRTPVPLGPPLTAPTPTHAYSYAMLGAGRVARFRIPDTDLFDNYGRLRIRVRAATAQDCATFGFAALGFADDASCVAATGLPESPSPRAA
jgi:hypothetical protein